MNKFLTAAMFFGAGSNLALSAVIHDNLMLIATGTACLVGGILRTVFIKEKVSG